MFKQRRRKDKKYKIAYLKECVEAEGIDPEVKTSIFNKIEWLKKQGGLSAMQKINKTKADTLYSAIDNSDFYSNPVSIKYRSWMNVPFLLADEKLNSKFLERSKDSGLLALKGHRSVGGMRASIYNAMPQEGVDALVNFMNDFEKDFG